MDNVKYLQYTRHNLSFCCNYRTESCWNCCRNCCGNLQKHCCSFPFSLSNLSFKIG